MENVPVSVADPLPLEQTDPALAEHIRQIVHGQHPVVKTLIHEGQNFHFRLKDGSWRHRRMQTKLPGRNDPCHCGSGVKFKKCCGK